MAITTTQQTSIMKASSALFNKAFSPEMVTDFVSFYESNGNDLAKLADALIGSSVYTAQYAGAATVAEFGTILMAHYGLSYTGTTAADTNMKDFINYSFTNKASWATSLQTIQAVDKYLTATFIPSLTTTDTVWGTMATAIENKATVATAFKNNAENAGKEMSLSSVTSDPATITAANAGATATAGTTFTLLAATDNMLGTNGNDTFIGDLSGTATLSAADTLNGGAGTDTFKIYGGFTAGTSATGNITNVENLYVATVADADQNFSALTKAATGITNIEIANASLLGTAVSAKTITTTAGQTLSLATGAGNVATADAVTWAGSATDTSLNLVLNGYQGATAAAAKNLTVTGAAATTLNIASTGANNKVATLVDPATVTSHVITGDKTLTYATDASNLNSINASAMTAGGVKVDVSAAATKTAFAFTGGAGNDSITFADNNLGSLLAGTQLNGGTGTDKIGTKDTAFTAAEYAAINAATNFEVLGLNAAITVDASKLTSIKEFALDTNGTQVITNMAAGSIVDVNVAHTSTLNLAAATGVNDLTLNVGTATTTGLNNTGTVTIGQTAVALKSMGTGTGTNTIATIANADNSAYTITGNQDLTITNALAGTAIGSKVDASAFTGKLNVTGSALSDIIIGGSGNDTINGGTITPAAAVALPEKFTVKLSGTPATDSTFAFNGVTTTSANTTLDDFGTAIAAVNYNDWTVTYDGATDLLTFTARSAGFKADAQATDYTAVNGSGTAFAAAAPTTIQQGTPVTVQSVDTLTGNAGADKFAFLSTDLDTTAGVVTAKITDFVSGTDTISTASAVAGSATNYVEATSAAVDLATLLAAADTALNGTVDYYVGQVGANSYLVTDNNGTGYTNVIELTGVALTGIAMTDIVA